MTRPRWREKGESPADRLRGGDAAAFERIVRENRRTVYLMARRILGSHEEADEAALPGRQTAVAGRTGASPEAGAPGSAPAPAPSEPAVSRFGLLSDSRGRLGERGEAAAEVLLRRAGMKILERRFRIRIGEIDLIAEHAGQLVFVEVKTRRGSGYGSPAEAITRSKRERMARVALAYLQRRSWLGRPCRFDVVEIMAVPGERLEARHIPDAFRLWKTG